MSSEITPRGESFSLMINGMKFSPGKLLYRIYLALADRVTDPKFKQDSCLINDGYEGSGKTNTSMIEAVILHHLTKFPISLFFKTSSAIEFLKSTERQIVILDEPALETLSSDTKDNLNRDFLRLISMMRKKRHILIINFAKFWKFPEWLVMDRPLGLVHMKGIRRKDIGRFVYIPQKNLETLWNDKKIKKKLSYERLKAFRSSYPYLMEEIFSHFNIRVEHIEHATYENYEEEKDKAIMSIGQVATKDTKVIEELQDLKFKISELYEKVPITLKTKEEFAALLQVNSRRIREWSVIRLAAEQNNTYKRSG